MSFREENIAYVFKRKYGPSMQWTMAQYLLDSKAADKDSMNGMHFVAFEEGGDQKTDVDWMCAVVCVWLGYVWLCVCNKAESQLGDMISSVREELQAIFALFSLFPSY